MSEIRSFRAFLIGLGLKFTTEEAKAFGFVYLEKENLGGVTSGTDAMVKVTKRKKICNCKAHMAELKDSLCSIGRTDLVSDVDSYLTKNPALAEHPTPPTTPTHTALGQATEENESDTSNSTFIPR